MCVKWDYNLETVMCLVKKRSRAKLLRLKRIYLIYLMNGFISYMENSLFIVSRFLLQKPGITATNEDFILKEELQNGIKQKVDALTIMVRHLPPFTTLQKMHFHCIYWLTEGTDELFLYNI